VKVQQALFYPRLPGHSRSSSPVSGDRRIALSAYDFLFSSFRGSRNRFAFRWSRLFLSASVVVSDLDSPAGRSLVLLQKYHQGVFFFAQAVCYGPPNFFSFSARCVMPPDFCDPILRGAISSVLPRFELLRRPLLRNKPFCLFDEAIPFVAPLWSLSTKESCFWLLDRRVIPSLLRSFCDSSDLWRWELFG